jgi:hypothetical protein
MRRNGAVQSGNGVEDMSGKKLQQDVEIKGTDETAVKGSRQ